MKIRLKSARVRAMLMESDQGTDELIAVVNGLASVTQDAQTATPAPETGDTSNTEPQEEPQEETPATEPQSATVSDETPRESIFTPNESDPPILRAFKERCEPIGTPLNAGGQQPTT